MKLDSHGRSYFTEQEIFEELYKNPNIDIGNFNLDYNDNVISYNNSLKELNLDWPPLRKLTDLKDLSVDDFHLQNQKNWAMPLEYKNLDIASWLLGKCKNQQEKQRVGQELILFQERNLLDLLRYMKYLVDTLNQNKIVSGVGRGSSVASFVLFLLGVHKINSLYYDLDISEFLK